MATVTQAQSSQASKDQSPVLWFEEVGIADIPLVGGKNASLGEMIQELQQSPKLLGQVSARRSVLGELLVVLSLLSVAITPKGVNVPTRFATTAYAYRY